MKHDEEKRKSLQVKDSRFPCDNFFCLIIYLYLFRYICIFYATDLLQVENEAAMVEVQRLQERLDASEHAAENLRRELRELGIHQGHTHTELHQARMQVAQLTLHLSEENLVLREERANWALEREACKHAAEVRIEEKRILCMQDKDAARSWIIVKHLFFTRPIKGNYKN